MKNNVTHPYYQIITKAIQYLADKRESQPSLADVSAHLGISEYHLQRIFSEWVGVSPKQFLKYLTKEYVKKKLRTETVMDVAFSAGLSGTGRLHDLMITCEGITPGEYKNLGKGLTIQYGTCDTPFGQCFIATTHRGICKLAFFDTNTQYKELEKEFHSEWSNAHITKDQTQIESLAKILFATKKTNKQSLKLLLKGSPFQLKVWEALLSIPEGGLVSYQEVATSIQSPTAVRAVATAIARNHIAYLIPCHRVIRQNGDFGQYRWNQYRKQALIAWEACNVNPKENIKKHPSDRSA